MRLFTSSKTFLITENGIRLIRSASFMVYFFYIGLIDDSWISSATRATSVLGSSTGHSQSALSRSLHNHVIFFS
jgi:hypothetical protein